MRAIYIQTIIVLAVLFIPRVAFSQCGSAGQPTYILCYPTNSMNMQATLAPGATGTWSVTAGTATIANPTSPTSLVYNIVGSVNLQWTMTAGTGCSAGSSSTFITIQNSAANAGTDKVSCGTTTMTATTPPFGTTGLWTIVSGSGNIVTPASPTTSITGVPTGPGTVFRWTVTYTNSGCSTFDDVLVTNQGAPPTANAGPDQVFCNGTSTTLAGNAAGQGTGAWSVVSGFATITTPSSPTSTVTNLVPGTSVTLLWTISGLCGNTNDTMIITSGAATGTPNAGPDQNLCSTTTANLFGNAAPGGNFGVWSLVSGTGNITSPGSSGTQVTGLVPGTSAVFRWTFTGGPSCPSNSDDVTISVSTQPTAPNAGADTWVCNSTTTTLAGNTPTVGTGTWSVVSGTGSVTTPSSPTSGVTGLTPGTATTFRWTTTNGACSLSDDVVFNVYTGVTSNAGPDQSLCNVLSVTMAANTPAAGAGAWSVVSGSASIANGASPTTTVGVSLGSTVTLRWTVTNGACVATDDVVVTSYHPPSTANAGTDITLCNSTTATLAAFSTIYGAGAWSVVSGTATVTTPSSPSSGVTGLVPGTSATLRWTVTNGSCTPTTDDVVINSLALPTTANAGADKSVCIGTPSPLAANTPSVGTGQWTVINGNATITTPSSPTSNVTGNSVGTATLRWTISNGTCPVSTDDVIITTYSQVVATYAGPDQTLCNATTATLAASIPTQGTGTWSVASGTATITAPASNTSGVTGLVPGTSATLRWTTSNGVCPSAFDDVVITSYALPTTANAGPDQNLCNSTVATLAGNTPTVGSGSWSVVSGTATITAPSSPTSGVTGLVVGGASVTLRWTTFNGTCASTDDVIITSKSALPSPPNAGPDQSLCNATTATLAATAYAGTTGLWSVVSGTATITTPSSNASGITGLVVGSSVTLRWTVSNGACTPTTDDVVITSSAGPTISNAGPDQTICNATSATLAANAPTVGTGVWTLVSGTATITTPTLRTSTVTGLVVGASATLRWTISSGTCTASADDVVIASSANPTASNAGPDQSLCNVTTATLAANAPTSGTGLWSVVSGTATITTPSSRTSGVTGLVVGNSVTLRWTISNGACTPSTDDVIITSNTPPTISNAGPDQSLCNVTTATLAANLPTAGTGIWTVVSGTASITTPTSRTSGVTGLVVGSPATLRWTISNGTCASSSDDVIISVSGSTPVANAGADRALCNVTTVTLAGNSPAPATGLWTVVSGTATITTPSSATSGVTGLAIGSSATLRWTITNGCGATSDDVIISVAAPPTVSNAGADQSICNATTTTMAGNSPTAGAGAWSLISGTATITTPSSPTSGVTGLIVGASATLRWTISNGACTPSTDDVIVSVIAAPTVANAGPDQILCNSTSAALAANAPTVGTGQWTIVSGSGGSFSNPGNWSANFIGALGTTYVLRWTITNGICPSSSDDVSITLQGRPETGTEYTLDKVSVGVNDPVTFTLGSYNSSNTYQLNWGDGNSQAVTSTSGVSHSYAAIGNYNVVLTTTLPSDPCPQNVSSVVTVTTCPELYGVSFSATQYLCAMKFTSYKIFGCLGSYSWNFGDGTTSTDRNPIHVYASPGSYLVTMSVSYDCSSVCVGTLQSKKQVVFSVPSTVVEDQVVNVTSDVRPGVIESTAVTFSDTWPLQHDASSVAGRAAYWNGSAGVWRNSAAFAYQISRTQSSPVNTRTDGTYTLNHFNWSQADVEAIPNWVKANSMTQYSSFGYELENLDVNGIYSSALYDYQGQLPVANGVNMRNNEMAFTGFESISGRTSGNWILTNQTVPAYTTYDIVSGRFNMVVIAAKQSDLAGVVNVDLVASGDQMGFSETLDSYLNQNQILCTIPHPTNPDWSVAVLKYAPQVTFWQGQLLVKNDVAPVTSAVVDNGVAHSGKSSLKADVNDKTFRQEILKLQNGKSYYLSAWVSVNNAQLTTPNLGGNLGITVTIKKKDGTVMGTFPFTPAGPVIEGWQQIKGSLVCPIDGAVVDVTFLHGTATAWYDDVRFHPENGNMKSYVYDPVNFRLKATLDEENFATYFYYDVEGNLYLTKKETREGVRTISENNSFQIER